MSFDVVEGPAKPIAATPDAHPGTGALPWLPGLDGLRAIAVVAVLAYHSGLGLVTGGFLGVDVFFVISGYLITGLLLRQHAATGRIDVLRFWGRRARRLLPALFFLLAAVLGFALLVLPSELARLRGDTAAAAGYVTNWYLILDQQSYFESVDRPSLLRHLWSLAIEEQFYVLWPVAIALGLAVFRRRGTLALTVGAAALSAAWMALLFNPDADLSRLYYGTDTHLSGLLVGAALAFVWLPIRPALDAAAPRAARLGPPDAVAAIGLMVLSWAFLNVDQYDEALYRGGFVLVALVTAIVIAAVVHPASVVGPRLLDAAPLRWLGRRSYGIYLWHWPVFTMTRPELDVTATPLAVLVLRVGLTLLLAEVSYRFVETPIRNGALPRAWAAWRAPERRRTPRSRFVLGGSMGLLLIAVVALGGQVVAAPPPTTPDYLAVTPVDGMVDSDGATEPAPDALVAHPGTTGTPGPTPTDRPRAPTDTAPATGSAGVTAPATPPLPSSGAELRLIVASVWPALLPPEARPPLTAAAISPAAELAEAARVLRPAEIGPLAPTTPAGKAPSAAAAAATVAGRKATPSADPSPAAAGTKAVPPIATAPASPATVRASVATSRALAVGDSVLLGAVRELGRAVGRLEVEAAVGRQVSTSLNMLRARRAARPLPDVVIVHVGNNGVLRVSQARDLMAVLAGVPHVVLVNLRVHRDYEARNNQMLEQLARDYPNVIFVDWHAASEGRPELFWKDGQHVRPEGALVYVSLIEAALRDHGVVMT